MSHIDIIVFLGRRIVKIIVGCTVDVNLDVINCNLAVDIIKWYKDILNLNNLVFTRSCIFNQACNSDKMKHVKWLYNEIYMEHKPLEEIYRVIRRGNLNVLIWAVEDIKLQLSKDQIQKFFAYNCVYNYPESAEYLMKKFNIVKIKFKNRKNYDDIYDLLYMVNNRGNKVMSNWLREKFLNNKK